MFIPDALTSRSGINHSIAFKNERRKENDNGNQVKDNANRGCNSAETGGAQGFI